MSEATKLRAGRRRLMLLDEDGVEKMFDAAPFKAIWSLVQCSVPLGERRNTSGKLMDWCRAVERLGYPVYVIEEALYTCSGADRGLPDLQEFMDACTEPMETMADKLRLMIATKERENEHNTGSGCALD